MIGTRKSNLLGKITVLFVICCCSLSAQGKYGGGTGEPDDPYLIYDANHMQAIGADANDWGKHFKLMANVDLGQFTAEEYNIIGSNPSFPHYGKSFTGVFDGNGHTISNFSYISPGTSYIGVFGYVGGDNAVIKDLGLIDPYVDAGTHGRVGSLVGGLSEAAIINCYAERGSVSGNELVGGLVGFNDESTISNCYSTASVSGNDLIGGLVGYNWALCVITNCYSTGNVTGDGYVGGLVGGNLYGTITNCDSSGDVEGNSAVGGLVGWAWDYSTITNCFSSGNVTGNGSVGGLVGINYESTISNCYSTAGVEGGVFVGGLVGGNREGSVLNCSSTGDVNGVSHVGGLVGHNQYGTITNCYATASVSGDDGIGGLVGSNWSATITNCYSTGSVTGGDEVGGLLGRNAPYRQVMHSFWDIETSGQPTSAGGMGLPTDQMQTMSTFTDAGWDFENIWWILEGVGYPRFCWEAKFGGGSGRHNDPYLIYTAEQMNTIGACQSDWDKHFKLMADIDLSDLAGTSFNIIGELYYDSGWIVSPFTGVFDGNGHILSNFTYTSTDTNRVGLFGYVDDPNAEIKDLGLINPNVNAGTGLDVGSLVGLLSSGKITNCYVEGGSISGDWRPGGLVGENEFGTITACYSTTSVSGDWYVGGLVGDNGGTITNCYSTDSVSGDWLVGGLVGRNYGTVINCYATASVSGTDLGNGGLVGENGGTITNCYSAGSVTGTTVVGGLVGHNHNGTISKCYSTGSVSGTHGVGGGLVGRGDEWRVADSFWDIESSGQITSDGGTGLPTDQMQMQITFTDAGWDFVGETVNGIEDIWFIGQQDYPHLWWEEMQVPMKLTPRTLNCRSEGNWVKAHLTLPEGFTVADVDPDKPAVLHSFGFQSAPLHVFINNNGLVQIEAAFEREQVCSLAGDWPQELTVAGFLTDGSIFLGTSTVRIIHPGMNVIEELAWYWLNVDCVQPDFCDGIDMNRDALVNLADYALLMNINVEFVTDE